MQMLLDPFEEQFHVPAFAVEFCSGQSFIYEIVGQEAVNIAGGEVFVSDHSQVFGITFRGLVCGKSYVLVSDNTSAFVNRVGFDDIILHIVLCPSNEERSVLVRVLSHAHYQELVVTGEVPDTIISVVTDNAIVELTYSDERHNLGKHCASLVHRGNDSGLCRKSIDSNRVHRKSVISS